MNNLDYLLFVFNKPVFFLVLMKLDYSSFWDRPLLHHHHNHHLEQKKEQTNNHYPIFPPDKKRKQHVKQHSLNNSAGTFNFFGHSQNNCIWVMPGQQIQCKVNFPPFLFLTKLTLIHFRIVQLKHLCELL